jgi:hypothetical protein
VKTTHQSGLGPLMPPAFTGIVYQYPLQIQRNDARAIEIGDPIPDLDTPVSRESTFCSVEIKILWGIIPC